MPVSVVYVYEVDVGCFLLASVRRCSHMHSSTKHTGFTCKYFAVVADSGFGENAERLCASVSSTLHRLLHLNDAIRDTSFCFQISDSDSDSLGQLFI